MAASSPAAAQTRPKQSATPQAPNASTASSSGKALESLPEGLSRVQIYRASGDSDSRVTVEIWIDGYFIAKLPPGSFSTLLLEAGSHDVQLWTTNRGLPKGTPTQLRVSDLPALYASAINPRILSPASVRLLATDGGVATIRYSSKLVGSYPNQDIGTFVESVSGSQALPRSLSTADPQMKAIYLDGSAVASKSEILSSKDHLDKLERRDAEGYDPQGYDRSGYDRYGWTSVRQVVAKISSVDPDGQAARAGLLPGYFVKAIDACRLSSRRDLSFWIRGKKAGDEIRLSASSDGSIFQDVALKLGEAASGLPGPALGFVAAYANMELPSENKNGDSWSGSISRGRQGWGILSMSDGSRYIGSFMDDKASGVGVLLPRSGVPQVQEWQDGALIGSRPPAGEIKSAKHAWIFLGQGGKDGLAEGMGDAVSSDGVFRVSQGLYSKRVLISGTMILPNEAMLAGSFVDEVLVSGRLTDADGSRYEGGFVQGVPEGKGSMSAADGTTYTGDFKAGKFDGEGSISKPDGERYDGSFRNGKPHGLGIYFNGSAIERCEYYDGQRIDQAYLIRVENEKQRQAMLEERERAAKEKADLAEQQRLAAERAADEDRARSEHSSNNLIAALFGIGTALAGSSIGLNAGESALLGLSAAQDVARDDASMTGMKAASQSIQAGRSSVQAPSSTAGKARTSTETAQGGSGAASGSFSSAPSAAVSAGSPASSDEAVHEETRLVPPRNPAFKDPNTDPLTLWTDWKVLATNVYYRLRCIRLNTSNKKYDWEIEIENRSGKTLEISVDTHQSGIMNRNNGIASGASYAFHCFSESGPGSRELTFYWKHPVFK